MSESSALQSVALPAPEPEPEPAVCPHDCVPMSEYALDLIEDCALFLERIAQAQESMAREIASIRKALVGEA